MENVDLTVLKPEDATLLRAVPVTSVLRGSLFNKKSNHFVPAEHGGPHPSLRHSVQVAGNAAFSVSYCPDVCARCRGAVRGARSSRCWST